MASGYSQKECTKLTTVPGLGVGIWTSEPHGSAARSGEASRTSQDG